MTTPTPTPGTFGLASLELDLEAETRRICETITSYLAQTRRRGIVVALANSLPAAYKLRVLDEKHVLKRAAAALVPAEILARKKQPYRAPDAASFFGPDRPEWVREVTSERAVRAAGVFEPDRVAGLLAKCERTGGRDLGNTDNMRALAVLSTQLTHELFVVGNDWAAAERALPAAEVAVDLIDDGSYP